MFSTSTPPDKPSSASVNSSVQAQSLQASCDPDGRGRPNTVTAPYTLNKAKQIGNLAKNATRCDFEIDVTSPHNTNIQCSAGFYEAIPKAALTTIKEGYQATISGVLVSCTESRAKRDQLGRNDNHVLRFQVANDGVGTAVLHLHHTQQLVQVQGSASRWFVDNFLKQTFLTEARNQRLFIADLNNVFDAAGRNHAKRAELDDEPKHCNHCNSKFRKTSKPSVCGNCAKYFHNTKVNKCLLLHTCAFDPRPSKANPITAPVTTFTPSASCSTTGSPSLSVTFVPASTSTSSNPPIVAPSASNSQTTRQSSPARLPAVATSPPIAVPLSSISPVIPQPDNSQIRSSDLNPSAVTFQQSQAKPTLKKKNTDQSKTVNEAEIAILKQELVILKTKLLQIEADNKDLVRKNSILSETIKIQENEQNKALRQKYFGDQGTDAPTNPQIPSPASNVAAGSPLSGLLSGTIDRIINYLLDIVQGPHQPGPLPATRPDSVPMSSHCTTTPPCSVQVTTDHDHTPSNSAPLSQPTHSPACPVETTQQVPCNQEERSDSANKSMITSSPVHHDISVVTIDEFMGENPEDNSNIHPLNLPLQTTQ